MALRTSNSLLLPVCSLVIIHAQTFIQNEADVKETRLWRYYRKADCKAAPVARPVEIVRFCRDERFKTIIPSVSLDPILPVGSSVSGSIQMQDSDTIVRCNSVADRLESICHRHLLYYDLDHKPLACLLWPNSVELNK
jgi:hypothetical protein